MSWFKQATYHLRNDAYIALIAINVAVFIVMKAGSLIAGLTGIDSDNAWLANFALASNLSDVASRPWSIVMYMFAQTDILHLIFNMLWLFCFGRLISYAIRYYDIVIAYIAGGLVGGILFIATYPLMSVAEGWLMGASASTVAIAAVTAVVMPEQRIQLMFLGQVRVIWLVLAVILMLILGSSGTNPGGAVAHLGGLIAGVVIGITYRYKQHKLMTTSHQQAELDRIIQKVKRTGYLALSSHERKRFFELSAKFNNNARK
jgi:membrane associated rhomboid family serine protease